MEVRSAIEKPITRLKDPRTIRRILDEGASAANSFAVLVAMRNDLQLFRYAVKASRSVGGAVERNRCKRRLRARLTGNLKQFETGMDCVLIARKKLLDAEPRAVDTAVQDLFNRMHEQMSGHD